MRAACILAVDAAATLGADLVGVDLLPLDDGYVALELNAAVDFTAQYALSGQDIYATIVSALHLPRKARTLPRVQAVVG